MNDATRAACELTERLRREHALLDKIVDNSTNIIFAFDRDLCVSVWNTPAERLTGVSKQQALGRRAAEVPRLFLLTGGEEIYQRVLAGENIRLPEQSFHIEAFGVEAVLEVFLTPLRDESQGVAGGLGIIHDITRYQRAEDELRASDTLLREAQRLAHVGSWNYDLVSGELRWSDEMFRITGREPQSFTVTTEAVYGLVHPQDRERVRASTQQMIATGESMLFREYRVLRPDGTERFVESRGEAIRGPDNAVVGLRGTWLDITERKRAEESREREREFRTLAENSTDIIARIDRLGRWVYVNPAIETVLGRARAEFLGKTDHEMGLPEVLTDAMSRALKKVLATGQPRALEATLSTPSGERYLDARLVPEFGPDGKVETVLMVERDITDLKRAQQALERLTLLDPLTGIANRRYLDQLVEREWRRATRHRDTVALIMVDIDHFKAFNDHYGHQQGDECLRQVAQNLRQTLHRPADTAARYGGEEFAIFLPETGLSAAREMAERLRQAVADLGLPHAASPVADRVTISLGVAAIPAHEGEFRDLMTAADVALYRAKDKGRNRVEMST